MANLRLVARLDIKGPKLIKGVQLEGVRVMGNPHDFSTRYYQEGIDELIYLDVVASLYGRNNLADIVRHTARQIFVPLTVGGGVRSVEDAETLLRAGADKIAINTAATRRPALIKEISRRFGAQCTVLSIEAKQMGSRRWQAYTDNGREPTGLDVVEWAVRGAELGAGEILLTSVDREGTRKGFDVELVAAVTRAVSLPVIASGGMGRVDHLVEVVQGGAPSAVAIADALHYERLSVGSIRAAALAAGLPVRRV